MSREGSEGVIFKIDGDDDKYMLRNAILYSCLKWPAPNQLKAMRDPSWSRFCITACHDLCPKIINANDFA